MRDASEPSIDTLDEAPEVGEISRIRTRVAPAVAPAKRAYMHEDSSAVAVAPAEPRSTKRPTLTPLFSFALPPRKRAQRPGALHLPGEDLEQSRTMAVQFLLDHMLPGEDGNGLMFHSPMKGRVLETALTLHILQRHSLDFEWQEQLRSFLFANVSATDLFSSTVARPVLMKHSRGSLRMSDPTYGLGVNKLLSGLQFARKRKRALLGTLLAEIGAVPFEAVTLDPDLGAGEAVHRFSQMYHAALKIIHEHRAPRGVDLTADIAFLEETQARDGSWEQQSLITLVALLALGPENRAFEEGLGFLKKLTREDGGVAFCENLNIWTTALGAIALLNSQQIPPRTLSSIASYFVRHQQPCGGWAFREHVEQTDTDTTAQCAQFLLQFDEDRYAATIDRAHQHLLVRQRPDGGYPTYEIAGESEATMTANIVLVQAMSIERHPEFREPIQRGLDFICAFQSPEGTFERSWSLSENYSIFRVNLAFNGCRGIVDSPAIEEAQRRSVHYLLTSQRPDGGWGQTASKPSDALSTSYALMTLALHRRQIPPKHFSMGLDYLISQQNPATGGIESIPDVVGPRPLVFDIPLLSTIFGVMAVRVLEQL